LYRSRGFNSPWPLGRIELRLIGTVFLYLDVPKDAAPRLVEHKPSQPATFLDDTALYPGRVTRRRRNSADNHIADLPFGGATSIRASD